MAANDRVKPAAGVLGVLLGSAFLLALLALYQWMELLVAQAGGELGCTINATLDCAPVWGSTAAKAIAGVAHMPVAALGLVWGGAASAIAGTLAIRASGEGSLEPWIGAARWTALAGVGASIGLAAVSLSLGVWCPTCMTTYALVGVFAGAAVKLPGAVGSVGLQTGLVRAIGIAAVCYVALLWPASRTPQSMDEIGKSALSALPPMPSRSATPGASPSPVVVSPAATPGASPVASPGASPAASPAASPLATTAPAPESPAGPGDVADLIRALPPRGQQILADVLLEYTQGPRKSRPASDPPRFVSGAASSPVTMVEWTDVMCGHCAEFVLTMEEVLPRLPPDAVRIEPRQFPLDQECNPTMQRTDGTGVRCAGARALVCLEGTPAFFEAQRDIFKAQSTLTKERVIELARAHAFDRRAFDACLTSPDTQRKIDADIAAALAADLHGTPHILLNGKVAPSFGPFIYLFLANRGRLDHPALAMLPKGQPPTPHAH